MCFNCLTEPDSAATLAAMIRSIFLALLLTVVFAFNSTAKAEAVKSPQTMRVYVGTYTKANSKGIYLYDLTWRPAALKQVGVAGETANPSFLAMNPDHTRLYAVGEVAEFEGKKTGVVSAFSVDGATGKLSLLNQQSTGGQGPCHVSLDARGKVALVANYGSGTIASLPIESGGKLATAASVIQHRGKSIDPARQTGPHAHGIWTSPDDRFVLTCDLGLDQVLVYRLDAETGKLTSNDLPPGAVAPGAGAASRGVQP